MTRAKVIELRDDGQDFTKLFVDANGVITGAWPFQGWVWRGCQVIQKRIRVGMRLRLRRGGDQPIILKYPVIAVQPDEASSMKGGAS